MSNEHKTKKYFSLSFLTISSKVTKSTFKFMQIMNQPYLSGYTDDVRSTFLYA